MDCHDPQDRLSLIPLFVIGCNTAQAQSLRESSAAGARSLSAYGVEMHYTRDTWFFQAQGHVQQHRPVDVRRQLSQRVVRLCGEEGTAGCHRSLHLQRARPEHAGYPNSHTHALSFTIPVGLNTIRISPVYRHVAGTRDLDSFAVGAGYDYNLSKRTALYARLGYIANRAKAAATLGAIPPGEPGDDLSTVAIGVRVRF